MSSSARGSSLPYGGMLLGGAEVSPSVPLEVSSSASTGDLLERASSSSVLPSLPANEATRSPLANAHTHQLQLDRYERQGKRPYMEDVSTIVSDEKQGLVVTMICDGHGSDRVARWMIAECPLLLLALGTEYLKGPWSSSARALLEFQIKTSLIALDERAYLDFEGDRTAGGCTMIAAMLVLPRREVVWINVGDSRGWMINSTTFQTYATLDHKPRDPAEARRVRDAGGWISADARVNGNLALSRAFGDWALKQVARSAPLSSFPLRTAGVTPSEDTSRDQKSSSRVSSLDGPVSCLPDVHVVGLGEHATLVLASDGIWDVFDHSEWTRLETSASAAGAPRNLAQLLVNHAYENGSTDNLTAIVIKWF